MSTTSDIEKAVRTATKALAAGNTATARRAMTYAASRMGLAGVVRDLADESLQAMLVSLTASLALRQAARRAELALHARNAS